MSTHCNSWDFNCLVFSCNAFIDAQNLSNDMPGTYHIDSQYKNSLTAALLLQ